MIAVIGAGPYGLAAIAHLRAAGLSVTAFGRPMSFWAENMPAGMLLRSPRVASSISDPHRALDLDRYSAATGIEVGSPVPLRSFLEYGRWFQESVVPDLDRRNIETLNRDGKGFRLALGDGTEVFSDRVVVATGIARFAHIPHEFQGLPRDLVSHTSWHRDLSQFSGRRVLVVGAGQSALESVALLHEQGSEVELVARAPSLRWLGQRRWLRSLGPASKLLYAPAEVGPPLLSQLVELPGAVRTLPTSSRRLLDRRSIRPAGAGWLMPRVDGVVHLRLGTAITGVESANHSVAVRFVDGSQEVFDHVLLGTGFRVEVSRYPFLTAELLADVRRVNGYPLLRRGLESSVPGLHFLGAPAAWTYGPLMRFVAGTPFAAGELTRFLDGSRRRPRATAVPV